MINIIGDVHLGKKFIDNVPLHRRGEREKLVLEDFTSRLQDPGNNVVQMGDLFDSFIVSNEVLLDAHHALMTAPPGRTTYLIRGNHDASRDTTKVSSWEVLSILCAENYDIKFISVPTVHYNYGFMPWDPFRSAKEQAEILVEEAQKLGRKLDAVFCHCDIKSYGGDDFNLLPYETLAKITDHVYTGHVHAPQEFWNGLKVTVTGSMQPYAHGEDPGTEWYVTMSKVELEALRFPELLKNKYVRIILGDVEEPPEPIDCLGFSIKKMLPGVKDEGDTTSMEVNLSGLNSTELLRSCLAELQVSDNTIQKILEKFLAAQSGN